MIISTTSKNPSSQLLLDGKQPSMRSGKENSTEGATYKSPGVKPLEYMINNMMCPVRARYNMVVDVM